MSFVPGGRRRCQLFCQSTDGTAKKVTVFPTAARGEPVNCPFSWRLAGVDAKLFGSCPLVLPTFLPPWCGRGRGWRFSGQIAHECAWIFGSRAPLLPKSLAARSRHGRRWQLFGQIPHEDARLLGSCAPILPRFLASRPGHGQGWRFSGHLARAGAKFLGTSAANYPCRCHFAAPPGRGGCFPGTSCGIAAGFRPPARRSIIPATYSQYTLLRPEGQTLVSFTIRVAGASAHGTPAAPFRHAWGEALWQDKIPTEII